MRHARVPQRSVGETRVGALSSFALCLAATAGTLAGGHRPVGTDTTYDAAVIEQPGWGDDLDHVIVMTDAAFDPDSTPLPPVTAPVEQSDVVGVDLPAAPAVTTAPVAGEPVRVGDVAVIDALSAVAGVAEVTPVAGGTFAVATSGSRDDLLAVPGIAGLVEDSLYVLYDDPNQSLQWAISNTGAAAQANGAVGVAGADANVVPAWSVSQGAGVVVAVVDTGVDLTHPDLAGRLWNNSDEVCANKVDDDGNGYIDDCVGWDFGANDANPGDDRGSSGHYHGTHVAGIIAAGRNGIGVVGVAPQATIMPVKISTTSGALSLGAIYSGIIYAADNGAKVMNMSFGSMPGDTRANEWLMEKAVKYATDRGVTLVAAAGNSAVDIGTSPVFPANFSLYYSGVITVGSTTNSDTRSSFSCFGSPVNIYAPGSTLLSTMPGGGYGFLSGTSMATPMVVGAVADMLAAGVVSSPSEARSRIVARSMGRLMMSW